MLIFHSFKLHAKAVEFAKKYEGTVYESQSESDAVEAFEGELKPPIVLVERPDTGNESKDGETEVRITQSVKNFGGKFAGS